MDPEKHVPPYVYTPYLDRIITVCSFQLECETKPDLGEEQGAFQAVCTSILCVYTENKG